MTTLDGREVVVLVRGDRMAVTSLDNEGRWVSLLRRLPQRLADLTGARD